MRDRRQVRLGATEVDACTPEEAVEDVFTLVERGERALVVTPNVDHLVQLERDPELRDAYARASLRVADGAPLVLLARLLRTPLPARVAGVDLTRAVLARAERDGRSVFFFGGAPDVLAAAVERVRGLHPRLAIVGSAAPEVDLGEPSAAEAAALAAIRDSTPDLLFVFLGAPKQEVWFWRRAEALPAIVGLAVGGTVDLLAGTKRRAPRWMQRGGLEWLYRLAQEPGRLARRYLVDDIAFSGIAIRELRRARCARRAR